ncbi:hypothetical protein D018_0282B, partial [Vibrio parahaemolyticus VP2007-007]
LNYRANDDALEKRG